MNRHARLTSLLTHAFAPTRLEVEDQSAQHAGHAGARPGGETHYKVTVVSEKFAGLSRPARHRLVYDALRAELASGLHALAVDAKAPGEEKISHY